MKQDKKEKKLRRSPASFRLRTEIADIISKAADELGWSEAEVVDACVLANVDTVVGEAVAQQRAVRSPNAVTELVRTLMAEEIAATDRALTAEAMRQTHAPAGPNGSSNEHSSQPSRRVAEGVRHTARALGKNIKKNPQANS